MGVVILGGLVSATALNMTVVPALYARFFRRGSPTPPTWGSQAVASVPASGPGHTSST